MSSDESAEKTEHGLTDKYVVLKDGEPQEGCFVLKPESDPAALAALKAYAKATEDHFLAADLSEWIVDIERNGGTQT